ncbi:MAG: CvpA family protein [Gammaproteobacteria bacterium]|jgi:membrane protein required for colicin V production
MITVDYIILVVIALSAVISLFRGFVKEAFSLFIWISAFWLSWMFFRDLAALLIQWISLPSARLGISFALIMIVVLIIGGIIGYLLSKLVEHTGLSGTDRLLGVFFGVARGVVIVAILILLAGLTPVPEDPWWKDSLLIGHFQEISVWLRDLLPEDIAQYFSY